MTADLVPVTDVAAIESLDPQSREIAVTQMLVESRTWLANAMATTDPTSAADLRIWLASVEQWTRRFNLAKDIQHDAQEMLRRAEYGISRKIVDGQENGEIETVTEARRRGGLVRQHIEPDNELKPQPTDFVSPSEWHGSGDKPGIHALGRDVTPDQFEDAIEDAKDEGNLSRANVVRKVKGIKSETLTTAQKIDRIREMSSGGHSSHQIARQLGNQPEWVRKLARDNDIEITADRVMGRTSRIDSNRIVQETVTTLEGLAVPLRLINYDDLDADQTENWANSLTESIPALNRFVKQIKEMTQ